MFSVVTGREPLHIPEIGSYPKFHDFSNSRNGRDIYADDMINQICVYLAFIRGSLYTRANPHIFKPRP
jgi:hypothetical protein